MHGHYLYELNQGYMKVCQPLHVSPQVACLSYSLQ